MKTIKKNQHVAPYSEGRWAVRKEGADKVSKTFSTQSDAVNFGRIIAKNNNAELFIHSKDGRIRDRNTYGKDRFPPKG